MQYKKGVKIGLILLCMLVLLSAVGCNSQEDTVQSHGMSFRENSVTVEKYETYALELLGAEGKQIEWKSNDESVATVENGVVCGWKKGNTQIVASVDGAEIACNVIVTDNQYVPVIKLRDTDELALDLGGTYSLKPVLYYNAREYTDVQYTYSCVGNAVTVDENGIIRAVEAGEALVCVQGTWRGNTVDASLTVYVIDVSTSVEVSGKEFDIYLNSRDEEFPASADLGISVFDQDTPVDEKDAAVKYIELIMAGDVEGAAVVENGVAHSKKIGSTHFVAEYTPAEREAVRTTVFAVNVHKCPADIYMAPIAGAEYETFISPANPMNTVKWDEEMGAFHLTNVNAEENDGRVFTFSREYIEKILQYTNAKSIVFEVKSDGIPNGSPAPDQVIYQGFMPNWYDSGEYVRIDKCDEWTKVEIFFDDIPLDSDGNRKSIMLLSTKEGMYIRNLRPMTEGSFLTMDLEFTTLGGSWGKDVEIGLYPHSYEGGINDYNKRVTIKSGTKTTVKVRLDEFLEGGKVPGFGLVVYGGPAWDAKLPDGYTPDRHTLKISNLRVTGEQNYSLDLSTAAWATGKKGTGFTDANESGIPSYEDGAIIITNGFLYDGHKFTLNSEEAKNRTYLYMDMLIDTLGGDWVKDIEVRFYPHNFEGNPHEVYGDRQVIKAGKLTTVKLDASQYLVDGKLTGIGLGIFGGPAWDAKLPDGYTPDRHTVTLSNIRLEGALNDTIDLSCFEMRSGTVDTGYTMANGSGTAEYVDGAVVITNGFCYDCHKITFDSGKSHIAKTNVMVDMQIDTLGGDWAGDIEIRFYPHNFEGNPHEKYQDKVIFKAGQAQTVKLNAENYLVDGKLTGIGIGIFGGPTWDAKLPDGYTPDRHTVTITGVRLEGEQNETIQLDGFTMTSGKVDTGYTEANGSGVGAFTDDAIVITNGFCYDCHKITFNTADDPGTTDPEPPVEDESTYVVLDMQFDTKGGNWAKDVEIRFYPMNFEGNPHETYTDKVIFQAGVPQTVKLDAEKYLADGVLSGIGIGIFGGPEWNTQIAPGNYDRHTVTISSVKLEGAEAKEFDLSQSTIKSGTVDTGYTVANGSGVGAFADGVYKITDGFCYDCHKLSLTEKTVSPDPEPPVEDESAYVVLDMQFDTKGGNWAKDVEIRFYPMNFEGNPHETYTDKVIFQAGVPQTVKLDAEKYLVDGVLSGIGIGIFGGPEWNTQIAPGNYDRHTVTISSVKLEGAEAKEFDLSQSTIKSGTVDTGYTAANGSGVGAFADGVYKITDGFCYDCHKLSLTEKTVSPDPEPPVEDESTYVVLDVQIDTLGGNWANDIELRFYAYDFAGHAHETYTDSVIFRDGEKQTVKLDAEKYLVDGVLPGIGVCIFGGPAWDAKLPDGYTPDRHTLTISNVHLEGAETTVYDLTQSVVTSGTSGTGYTSDIFGPGVITVGEELVLSDGFRYFGHKISLTEKEEPGETEQDPYVVLDMQIDTKGGNWAKDVEIRFYPMNFEGNPHETYTDKVIFRAGVPQTVKLDPEKYLIDGVLSGIGIGIFGGPEWNTQIAPGNYDRHTVTISSVKLEGAEAKEFDLSQSTIKSGTADTGYTVANGSGVGAYADGVYKITNGFCYDCHKLSLTEKTESGEEEQDTYIVMDVLLTTLSNSTNPVEIRFCNYNQEDSVHTTYTDLLHVTAGTKTTVRLKVDNYLVDGALPGFSIGIFGGPEWNTQISAGVYDRHSVVISDLRLEGAGARDIDLSAATVATGIPGSNTGGSIAIVDGQIVISGGFRYDGHRITLG